MKRPTHLRPAIPNRMLMTITAAIAFTLALTQPGSTATYTYKILHSFCSYQNCNDGGDPTGGLLLDSSGNLYGVNAAFGKNGKGVVFKLVPNGDKTQWKEYMLHAFCAKPNCADGSIPTDNLIMDVSGNLYGTASEGGKFNNGIVFELLHGAHGWGLKVLHNFCPHTGCLDGSFPEGGLAYARQTTGSLYDGNTALFGTAFGGGKFGDGTAFELVPNGSMVWKETVLYHFDGLYGDKPRGLVSDDSGANLWGYSPSGGSYDDGLLFELPISPHISETVVHNFCSWGDGCIDGAIPQGSVTFDNGVVGGDIYGTANAGGFGNYCFQDGGCGVAFQQHGAFGKYSVLYFFCALPGCTDGELPVGGLLQVGAGDFLGMTELGGSTNYGTIFELSNAGGKWVESVLHSFCSDPTTCTDGAEIQAPLISDSSGNIYGTTIGGGANGWGTVFELVRDTPRRLSSAARGRSDRQTTTGQSGTTHIR